MSIVNKLNNNTNPTPQGVGFQLDNQEIEYLLDMIKNSSFPGTHLEMLYGIVYKLQQQYLSQK